MVSSHQSVSSALPVRWRQLLLGVVCMMLIANLQYSWTLFVKPMGDANSWSLTGIQWAFSIFIALETWFTPGAGWLVDRLGPQRGPKLVVALGGTMVAMAWVIDAYATSLTMLYVGAAVSGLGAGGIYAACVGSAVKWFPDRRGLAVGITAGGFGAGAALTVIPIKMMIESRGYADTFLLFGLLQGGAVCLIAMLLRGPRPAEVPASASASAARQSSMSVPPRQMLCRPVFWLLYAMFVLVSASGLMATAQLALIASDLKVSNTVIFLGASTLSLALVVDNLMNGLARPLFGWISDHIGREFTMVIAFGCGGISYLLLDSFHGGPWMFVLLTALVFFTWGEIFSLFPSICTDMFGTKYATVNASLLYTAKGASALLVPLSNVIKDVTGSWSTVFLVTALMNFTVVLLAMFVLRPVRASHQALALVQPVR